jgi:type IX secretion system PorP/SprF family membrane protein
MKKIVLTVLVIFGLYNAKGQQIITFSQYIENQYSINPAVAGTGQYSPLAMSYRRLWTGISSSPMTQYISSHIPFKDNVGIGCKIYNYSAGPISTVGVEGTYAYRISLGPGSHLSLGLSALLYEYRLDKSKLFYEQPDDKAITGSSDRMIVPDASFGAYYYNNQYYAGLSVTNLFNRKINLMNNGILQERQVRHYFLNGGYLYTINNSSPYVLEPNLLIKFIEAGIIQAEIGCRMIYQKTWWGGLSYRTQDALIFSFGVRKDRFTLGYSYDYTLSSINKYTKGSHEILFIYSFNRSRPKLL